MLPKVSGAAAKASILKKVADGKLGTVETFTKTGQPMMYEAAYTDKKGHMHEVLVKRMAPHVHGALVKGDLDITRHRARRVHEWYFDPRLPRR